MNRALSASLIALAVSAICLLSRPDAGEAAPVKERRVFPLAAGGSIRPDDLSIRDLAVVDEDTVVAVGTTFDKDDETNPINLGPNGAVVDLAKKTSRPFTNGHKACICAAAVGRGRVATTGTTRDPFLRLWDLKAGKPAGAVQIDEPEANDEGAASAREVGLFHKSDRVAVAVKDTVLLFDPAKPDERTELTGPEGLGYFHRPVISPDDARIAATAVWSDLVICDLATKKSRVVSLAPPESDPEKWMAGGCTFGPDGVLIAWRAGGFKGEEPRAKGEDVPADRCEVVRIDGDKVVPLGIGGGTLHVFHCAIDPSGTWLAVAGSAELDKPRKDGSTSDGELRVYHLPTRELAFRESVEGLPLTHVAFTPSGKRVVCCTYDGFVRWWDLRDKKK